MSTNLRKAQKHMQRAKELLNQSQLGFGANGEEPPLKRQKTNEISASEPERRQLEPGLLKLVTFEKQVRLKSIPDSMGSTLLDKHKEEFDWQRNNPQNLEEKRSAANLSRMKTIDVIVKVFANVRDGRTNKEGTVLCKLIEDKNNNLTQYLKNTDQFRRWEIGRGTIAVDILKKGNEPRYWVLDFVDPIFCYEWPL